MIQSALTKRRLLKKMMLRLVNVPNIVCVFDFRGMERTTNMCSSTRLTPKRWSGAREAGPASGSDWGERWDPPETFHRTTP